MHKIIAPVYNVSNTEWSNIAWVITFVVLFVSIYKIYNNEQTKRAIKTYYESKDFSFENKINTLKEIFLYD
jgi:hypothetical protein